MRKLIVLVLLLISCSPSLVKENANSVVAPDLDDSDSARKKNESISKSWEIRLDNPNFRTALVMTSGKAPNGEAQTILLLRCPAKPKYLVSIEYIVRGTGKIAGFNFNDFEGPDAPAQRKKLIEFRATSPRGKLTFVNSAAGGYGGAGEPDAFFFVSASTKQDRTMQLAQMIAKGSTELTVIVRDFRDNRKTIETTFPAIDGSSEVAKILNGCR